MLWMPHGLIDPRDADRARAALTGGDPVALAPAGGLALLATAPAGLTESDPAAGPIGEDPDQAGRLAKAHHDALCRLAAVIDVLPLRFGAATRTPEETAAGLAGDPDRADALKAAFLRIRGAAEYQIRLLISTQPGTPPGTPPGSPPGTPPASPAASRPTAPNGRAYLRRKLDRRQDEDRRRSATGALLDRIRGDAARLGRASVEVAPGRPDLALDLSVLAARGSVEALSEAGGAWAALAEPFGLTLRITGPLPAFRFVDPSLDRAPAQSEVATTETAKTETAKTPTTTTETAAADARAAEPSAPDASRTAAADPAAGPSLAEAFGAPRSAAGPGAA
ncbi:MAG: GvpL/GvpF family gas vesicle protein [Pseudomonadota bacterium]